MIVGRTPHPGPLPIGSADSADAEREKRSQHLGKATTVSCSKAHRFYEISQRLFLLPAGEGQDEGERGYLSSSIKLHLKLPQLAAMMTFLFISISAVHAQQVPVGHATDFVSSTYFEPPNEQQVKLKLSGAEALPLPGGLQDIRQLRIETFEITGKTEMIVNAPQCNYSLFDGVANSAGHMELQTGDGKFRVEGDGFLWRQNDQLLIISNNVHTVIKSGVFQFSAP